METCIEVQNVVKRFRDQVVLKNVSISFEKGQIHGIVGRNGSGKTVLFKCICGLMHPEEGVILVSRKHVGKYSLGMRQRLGIAQAIMEDPEILILDEPMNGLDNAGVQDIRALLLELKAQGKTILLASHNHEDIAALCDTVHEMDGGVLE